MKFTKIIATTLMTLSLVSILPTYSAFADTEAEELIASAEKVHLDDTSNIYYKKDNKYYMIKGDVVAKNCIWGKKYATEDGSLAQNGWYNCLVPESNPNDMSTHIMVYRWRYYKDFEALKNFQIIDGKKYFFNSNGNLKTGWFLTKAEDSGSNWHYAKEDGSIEAGWVKNGEDWYYVNENGQMQKNTTINGYTLDKKGRWVK